MNRQAFVSLSDEGIDLTLTHFWNVSFGYATLPLIPTNSNSSGTFHTIINVLERNGIENAVLVVKRREIENGKIPSLQNGFRFSARRKYEN